MIAFTLRFIVSFAVLALLVYGLTLAGGKPGTWTPWVMVAAALLMAAFSAPVKKGPKP